MTDRRVHEALRRLARLESFLEADPDNPTLRAEAFRLAVSCGEWQRAQSHLADAQRKSPGDPAWALREVDLLLARKHFDEARTVLRRLGALAEPGSALEDAIEHDLAAADFGEGDFLAASARLRPIVAGNPRRAAASLRTQLLWVRALHRAGMAQRACEWVRGLENTDALNNDVAGVAALAAIDCGDLDSAERWAELGVCTEEPCIEAWVAQSTVALARRDAAAAIAFADRALALNGREGRAWSARGFAALLAGTPEAAAADFERAVALMPMHVGTWHGHGWSRLLLQSPEAAQASFERALSLDRGFAETHGALAVVCAVRGLAVAAGEHIERAERLDRNCLASRYARAILAGEASDAAVLQALAQRLLSQRPAPLGGRMSDWLPGGSGTPGAAPPA
ncbi:tetratricopeptide repeat protein [Ramlibacter sp.]|uniref:tetratricopeptide repeat protein n=1 Tax=Ramlibacter sp. TaxID=1917967 RepID=UPI003D0C6196